MVILSCLNEFEANPGTQDPRSEKQKTDVKEPKQGYTKGCSLSFSVLAIGQLFPTSAVTAAVFSVPGVPPPSLTIGVVAWSFLHHVWSREVGAAKGFQRGN